jgi:hypothetical protein
MRKVDFDWTQNGVDGAVYYPDVVLRAMKISINSTRPSGSTEYASATLAFQALTMLQDITDTRISSFNLFCYNDTNIVTMHCKV